MFKVFIAMTFILRKRHMSKANMHIFSQKNKGLLALYVHNPGMSHQLYQRSENCAGYFASVILHLSYIFSYLKKYEKCIYYQNRMRWWQGLKLVHVIALDIINITRSSIVERNFHIILYSGEEFSVNVVLLSFSL